MKTATADGAAGSSVLQSASAVAQSILSTIQTHSNGVLVGSPTASDANSSAALEEKLDEDGFSVVTTTGKSDATNTTNTKQPPPVTSSRIPSDEALQRTIEASRLEAEAEEKRKQEEEETLKKVLELSMTDK